MNTKFIHLLYVPTMACNMQCRYCYLEDNTVDTLKGEDCVETLRYAIAKFREADVVPFNISCTAARLPLCQSKNSMI